MSQITALLKSPLSLTQKMRTSLYALLLCVFCLTGCGDGNMIVSQIDERDANIIIVFLESKGITAKKEKITSQSAVAGESSGAKYNIFVDKGQAIEAMSILNMNGLPQRRGTNLLELFAKQGFMSSDKEESIRYQAGLAQQISNMILMIDGVIDATVQLSFPEQETTGALPTEETSQHITASVFVKHQGVVDDPNSHLELKIKRLVSGSVSGLDLNDVTVVSDRSRFTDVVVDSASQQIESQQPRDFVRIWSITMSRDSVGLFRFLFFFITSLSLLFLVLIGWMIWKLYPFLRQKGGWKKFVTPSPFSPKGEEPNEPGEE